jgi:acetyl-CoA carboxylase biotin carboxyl carrier protein
MDLDKIRELLRIVAESGVAEVEIEEDDFKLTARKTATGIVMQSPPMYAPYGMGYAPPYGPAAHGPGPMPHSQAPPPEAPVPTNAQGGHAAPTGASAAPAPPQEEAPADEDSGTLVRAPIVGTFYEAPAPDADPYVQAGDTVAPGDVLCIIEAMKLMNEIECEVSGTIKKVLVENAEPVEYDQPLFVIEAA